MAPTVTRACKLRPSDLLFPAIGILLGAIACVAGSRIEITVRSALAIWLVVMLLVLILGASFAGARAGSILAGAALAVPCFIHTSAIERVLMMVFMSIPFAASVALVLIPPIAGFRTRLAYLTSWGGTRQVIRNARRVDIPAARDLLLATAIFAAAIALIQPGTGIFQLIVRWLAGGVATLAFAEMLSSCLPLVSSAIGVEVPALFRSPHKSRTLTEFWTRRWNRGASEKLFHPFCYAPLARGNAALAMVVAFVVSAAAHFLLAFMALGDWGIAAACGAFFVVQPILISVERKIQVRRWNRVGAHMWTITALAVSSPLFVEPVLQIMRIGNVELSDVLPVTFIAFVLVAGFSALVAIAALASCPSCSKNESELSLTKVS